MLTYLYLKIIGLIIKYQLKKKYNDWLIVHTPYFYEYLWTLLTLHLAYLVVLVILFAHSYYNLPPEAFHPKT